ncbi:hypothetical protein DFA_04747 [Cavenderia fasciculata]|uniref:Uncharacterized protein n=1 Tax=Cavenderia fasciculata TaxID=261658 RepID=F4PQF4_CACFS|nr:uncharacterized protein DFA_04747 [Cavenderia fasciculata]EGG22617.1 hypothetical protein DFA_04747 [Cavenderia fasciculata]|eukprot:XP_004360468.1 hypothetical protein DFA_04747 [Cavenderia fasciculata]
MTKAQIAHSLLIHYYHLYQIDPNKESVKDKVWKKFVTPYEECIKAFGKEHYYYGIYIFKDCISNKKGEIPAITKTVNDDGFYLNLNTNIPLKYHTTFSDKVWIQQQSMTSTERANELMLIHMKVLVSILNQIILKFRGPTIPKPSDFGDIPHFKHFENFIKKLISLAKLSEEDIIKICTMPKGWGNIVHCGLTSGSVPKDHPIINTQVNLELDGNELSTPSKEKLKEFHNAFHRVEACFPSTTTVSFTSTPLHKFALSNNDELLPNLHRGRSGVETTDTYQEVWDNLENSLNLFYSHMGDPMKKQSIFELDNNPNHNHNMEQDDHSSSTSTTTTTTTTTTSTIQYQDDSDDDDLNGVDSNEHWIQRKKQRFDQPFHKEQEED